MRVVSRRALVLLALALALAALLHSPPVKRAAGGALISFLEGRLGGTGALEALDYRLWRGEVELAGFGWSSGEVQLRAPSLLVRWSPWTAIEVRATDPDLRVTLAGSSSGGSTAIPAVPLGARVTIANGTARIEWPEASTLVELSSIEGTLVPDGKGAQASIDAAAGRVRREDDEIDFGPARTRVRLSPAEVQIEELRVEKDDSFLNASGRLGPLSPLTAEVRFQYSIEGSLASAIDPRIGLEEPVTGEGSLRRRPGVADEGAGVARTRSVSFDSFGPFGIEASWRWLDGRGDADVTFEGGAPAPIASRVDGRFSLSVDGFDLETARGEGLLSLRRSEGSREAIPLSGDVAVRLESSRISFSTEGLTLPGAEIAGSGALGETIEGRFHGRVEDIARLPVPAPPVLVSGPLALEGTVSGTLASPAIEARLSSNAIRIGRIGEETFALTGTTRYRGTRIEIEALALRGPGESSVVVDGALPTSRGSGELDLNARIERMPLAGVVASLASGTVSATLEASGDISRPTYEASFEASDLASENELRADLRGTAMGQGLAGEAELLVEDASFRGNGIPGARVSIDSDGETAVLSAELDDGREIAAARVGLRAPFPLEAEIPLGNIPFDRVREVFPELGEAGMELEVGGRARIEALLDDFEELEYRVDVDH
ncbi:MAG TPA: hypothetical protein VJ921_02740, partial [Vicinamibacteria bacterium]|nr:hypothetical protein [Vicinamibacteria bacterium]